MMRAVGAWLICVCVAWCVGCGGDAEAEVEAADKTDDVVEIAIRRLNAGQEVPAFEAARDAFVAKLRAQPGVLVDRELRSILDYSSGAAPQPAVYIGMTQYEDLGAFQAAGAALGGAPEASAFFGTFQPELFTALKPLKAGTAVELAKIASGSGHVLEVAVRDLGDYPSFDAADYAVKRDAFLAKLAAQPGFVSEHQWVSATDAEVVVGMTVYESAEAFGALAADAAFINSPEAGAFLGKYPAKGHVNVVVR